MKIVRNIPGFTKLVWSILKLNKYIPLIEGAKARGDFHEERVQIAAASQDWINRVMEIYDTKFEITGQENIPEGPCVFIANHQAYCDVPAVLKAFEGKAVGFIAKAEFKPVPFLSSWILRTRGLFIPTNGADPRESLKIINQGIEYIKEGFSMMIFPEGRRSWGPEMGEFKPGSFKLATKAKVPVVPITINGTYKMFEDQGYIKPGLTATVIIHPAIETANLTKAEEKELPDKVHEIIKSALPSAQEEADSDLSPLPEEKQ